MVLNNSQFPVAELYNSTSNPAESMVFAMRYSRFSASLSGRSALAFTSLISPAMLNVESRKARTGTVAVSVSR